MKLEKDVLLYKAVLERLYEDAKSKKYRREAMGILENRDHLEFLADMADEDTLEVVNKLRDAIFRR